MANGHNGGLRKVVNEIREEAARQIRGFPSELRRQTTVAVVEEEKVVEYLLHPTHPDNGGKAAFFQTLGFDRGDWPLFATALRRLAVIGEIARNLESSHGSKYVVDGRIEAPRGKSPMVRSIWIVDRGLAAPRLATAYPREERE